MSMISVHQHRGRPRWRPRKLAGDKGYSCRRIRVWLRSHRIEPVIPKKKNEHRCHPGRSEKFDKQAYRRRNVVERCIGWLKENRRIAMRYEKLAVNYLAMIKLAMIRRYLANEFSDRA